MRPPRGRIGSAGSLERNTSADAGWTGPTNLSRLLYAKSRSPFAGGGPVRAVRPVHSDGGGRDIYIDAPVSKSLLDNLEEFQAAFPKWLPKLKKVESPLVQGLFTAGSALRRCLGRILGWR